MNDKSAVQFSTLWCPQFFFGYLVRKFELINLATFKMKYKLHFTIFCLLSYYSAMYDYAILRLAHIISWTYFNSILNVCAHVHHVV